MEKIKWMYLCGLDHVELIEGFFGLTYFLKKKSEVFKKFKEFKALIENHSERRIKTLRSDNGG